MLRWRVVAVIGLVLLAGCSGGSLQETTPTSETTTAPAETTTTTSTTTTTTEKTTTATTKTTTEKENVANPWGKQNVTVAVWNSVNQSRDVTPLVNRTLDYWNGDASEYGRYNVTFVPTMSIQDADILVKFVGQIAECGYDVDLDSTVGCAPIYDEYSTPAHPVEIEVVAGYSDESTTQILKHEFGHVLGIEHGEEPLPLMEPTSHHEYLSQTDLGDRAVPWRNDTLSVHVDVSTLPGHDRDDAREQIRHALDYYESGADGAVPDNVSFVQTSNRPAADVQIRFPDDPFDCAGERVRDGSCGSSWIYDTDTDDAPEYFASYEIRVRGIDPDAIGWHVGYWLSEAMGLSEDELPEPFVDADYDDRRDEWWE